MANFNDTPEVYLPASTWSADTAEASEASPVKRLDPRISLFILVLLNATAFMPTNMAIEGCAVLLCAAVMWWSNRRAAMLRWLAAYAVLFAGSMVLALYPGDATASFAAMVVTFRRVFCVGMFASNMIATTRVGEMAAALQRLCVPRGMVCALCVALRFFPTMRREFVSVAEAMRVRGFAITPASVLRHPATMVENLMVPVMSRLAIVADELSNAAIVRGIDSAKRRTSYYELRLKGVDVVFLALFAAVAAYVVLAKAGIAL